MRQHNYNSNMRQHKYNSNMRQHIFENLLQIPSWLPRHIMPTELTLTTYRVHAAHQSLTPVHPKPTETTKRSSYSCAGAASAPDACRQTLMLAHGWLASSTALPSCGFSSSVTGTVPGTTVISGEVSAAAGASATTGCDLGASTSAFFAGAGAAAAGATGATSLRPLRAAMPYSTASSTTIASHSSQLNLRGSNARQGSYCLIAAQTAQGTYQMLLQQQGCAGIRQMTA